MRELVMKYKAEKVCHEEMVKMPLVDWKVLEDGSFRICMDYRKLSEIAIRNRYHQMRVHEDEIPKIAFKIRYGRYEFMAMPFWVDQCTSDFHGRNESGGVRVAFEDEFGAAEEREVSCEAQQGRSRVKRKLFGSCRNNMGNESILALPEGSDNFVVMRGARVRMEERRMLEALGVRDKECDLGDVRSLIMEEAHETKYSVRPGAEIEESKMIGLKMEQETTNVVVIKEMLKEAKDRQESVVHFGKKCELAPRLFARLIEEFGFALHRASQAGQSCAETYGTVGYDPPQMIVIAGTTGLRGLEKRIEMKECLQEVMNIKAKGGYLLAKSPKL
nr:hypothetical protein [Tanacetum cinerariifolium]